MPYSMTGWGTAKTPKYTINLRGLNSKFKEVLMHVPQEFFEVEPFIYKHMNEKITRGRVDVYINIDRTNMKKNLKLDEQLFRKSYMSFKKMLKNSGISHDIQPDTIINNVEGIIIMEDAEVKSAFKWEKIRPHLEKALKDFQNMKAAEGKRLAADIIKKADIINCNAAKIKKLFAGFKKEYTGRAKEKIEKIISRENNKKYLNTEVVEVLDKHNITEELVRIGSHIKQLKVIVKQQGVIGRKIDFLAQELYRECNTIGSKISESSVAHCVVAMKEATEKIREQAMNLE